MEQFTVIFFNFALVSPLCMSCASTANTTLINQVVNSPHSDKDLHFPASSFNQIITFSIKWVLIDRVTSQLFPARKIRHNHVFHVNSYYFLAVDHRGPWGSEFPHQIFTIGPPQVQLLYIKSILNSGGQDGRQGQF